MRCMRRSFIEVKGVRHEPGLKIQDTGSGRAFDTNTTSAMVVLIAGERINSVVGTGKGSLLRPISDFQGNGAGVSAAFCTSRDRYVDHHQKAKYS